MSKPKTITKKFTVTVLYRMLSCVILKNNSPSCEMEVSFPLRGTGATLRNRFLGARVTVTIEPVEEPKGGGT
jgi:hypothetical protein